MAHNEHISEWDCTHFPRERTTGVVLGLNWIQVGVIAAGVGVAMGFVVIGGFPTGLIMGLLILVVTVAVAIPRPWARSLPEWAWALGRLYARGSSGQTRYRRKPEPVTTFEDRASEELWTAMMDEEDQETSSKPKDGQRPGDRDKFDRIIPGKGARLNLPGEANELKIFTLPGGAGLIFDPRSKEAIVIAQITTEKAFALESDESMEDRSVSWRSATSAIAGIPGITRVQESDQTTLVSGARVKAFFHEKSEEAPKVRDSETGVPVPLSADRIDPIQTASYEDLIDSTQDQPVHEMWLTLVLSAAQLERRILAAGGGLPGFMEVSLGVMSNVELIVPESGAHVAGWHTPRSVAALCRTAMDPDSTLQVSDREADQTGVAPAEAGPMAMDEWPNYVESDGWFHRTFMISEWPQAQADRGFLEGMVLGLEFRHTISVMKRPKDLRASLRKLQQRKTDWETAEKIRVKLDRPITAEHVREREDIAKQENELMRGSAPVDIGCLITISAQSIADLEAHTGDLQARAIRSNCEIRSLWSQQGSAFIAGALPMAWMVFD